MVWEWTKDVGEIDGWPQAITQDLDDTQHRGKSADVIQDWKGHADVGRTLMKDLQSLITSSWPTEQEILHDIFRQAFDLFGTLHAGITTIETYFIAVYGDSK